MTDLINRLQIFSHSGGCGSRLALARHSPGEPKLPLCGAAAFLNVREAGLCAAHPDAIACRINTGLECVIDELLITFIAIFNWPFLRTSLLITRAAIPSHAQISNETPHLNLLLKYHTGLNLGKVLTSVVRFPSHQRLKHVAWMGILIQNPFPF